MTKDIAIKVMQELFKFSQPLNTLTDISEQLDSDDQSREMRRHLAAITIQIDEIMRPIVRTYPDLDPGRDSN
jgi:hypothetical protein